MLVSSKSRPGRSRPDTSITVNWLDSGVVDQHLGRHREGADAAAAPLAPLGHQRAEPDLALEQLLDGLGDAPRAPQLVLVLLELARQQEGVEREAVARRRDVRARDVGAGGGAGAGEQRQQARMVGREQRQLGDGGEGVGGEVAGELARPPARRARTSLACSTALRVSVLQPVVGIVPLDEALDLLGGPIGDGGAEGVLRRARRARARPSCVCPPATSGSVS